MMVSRPASEEGMMYRHEGGPIPANAQLSVGEDDNAVFTLHGQVLGVLGEGQHPLAQQPFLQSAMGQGGLTCEVIFVRSNGTVDVSGNLNSPGVFDMDDDVGVFMCLEVSVPDPAHTLRQLPPGGHLDEEIENAVFRALPAVASQVSRLRIDPEDGDAIADALIDHGVRQGFGLKPMGVEIEDVHELSLGDPEEDDDDEEAGGGAAAFAPGTAVQTKQGFGGEVVRSMGNQVEVRWQGGAVGTIAASELVAAAPAAAGGGGEPPQPGTRVLAQFADGNFYPATVQYADQSRVEVAFDDGRTAQLTPQQIRSA